MFILGVCMLFGIILICWVMLLISQNSDSDVETAEVLLALPMYTVAFIAATLGISSDNAMNSDIRSGWLNYSYAMPIKPSHRALARIAYHAIMTVPASAIYLITQALFCKYLNKEFSLHYVTLLMLCIAGSMAMQIIMNLYTLSSRTMDELKKAEPKQACTLIGITILLVIIMKLTIASDREKFLEKLTTFRLTDKVALIGLLIGLAAIAVFTVVIYFLDCRLLGNPYGGISARSKTKAKTEKKSAEKLDISENDGHSSGFLYKELRQHKSIIIFITAMPFIGIAASFLINIIIALNDEESLNWYVQNSSSMYARAIILGVCTFIVMMLMDQIISDGGKKINAYFIATLPGGIQKTLYYKYVAALMVDAFFFASLTIADSILCTISYYATGNAASSLSGVFFAVFFMILFMTAINTPVTMRFGEKSGTLIRMIGIIGLTIVIMVIFCFMGESAREGVLEFLIKLFKGEAPQTLMMILSLSPIVIIMMYPISYKISTKSFMKGVQSYDK